MAELPSGTVTFLFTDIEGSTARWEHHPEAMRAALAQHDALVRAAVAEHQGHVVKTTGDGVHFGPPLNRAARLMATAHGGQVLLSDVTAGLVRDDLPDGLDLLNLGE